MDLQRSTSEPRSESAILVGVQQRGQLEWEVQDSLEPNSSALFIIVREADPSAAVAALSAYKGKIYHTSLPSEAEETLRKAMK